MEDNIKIDLRMRGYEAGIGWKRLRIVSNCGSWYIYVVLNLWILLPVD
jgi:hypothetical protein